MFTPESLISFPKPFFSRIAFAGSVRAILYPFAEDQVVSRTLEKVNNLRLPIISNESALILLKLRAFASKQENGTNYLLILVGMMSCEACMKLVLSFFDTEIFAHNLNVYPPFLSPPLDSIGSPTLFTTGVFRERGLALQRYDLDIPQELFRVIDAVLFSEPQIRILVPTEDNEYIFEAVLPEGYLDGILTVDLLRLLVEHAQTLRRCRVDPLIGIGLFCVTLDGELKLDVWRNANTTKSRVTPTEFDQNLGRVIKGILNLHRPYCFLELMICF